MPSAAQLANLNFANGWDRPPGVFSSSSLDSRSDGEWNARECHWKTPQRLFTLNPNQSKDSNISNSFCAPIIVYNKYILVANGMSISLYGNLDSELTSTKIDTATTSPLTQFSLGLDSDDIEENEIRSPLSKSSRSCVVQMIFHEETGILYILTVESCIFQVKLLISQSTSNYDVKINARENIDSDSQKEEIVDGSDSGLSELPKFHRIHNWVTKNLGVTCMATLHDGGGKGIDTICVGYKSGCIEAWNVSSSYPTYRKDNPHRTTRHRMQWEGYMDSVRTLSFLFRSKELQNDSLTKEISDNNNEGISNLKTNNSIRNENIKSLEKAQEYFLIVTIQTDKGLQQTSSMLTILDLKRIMDEARMMDRNRLDISLQKYTLSPTEGTGLIDATAMPVAYCGVPKRVPILESHGADAVCVLNSSCVGISFPDGITSFITSDQNLVDTVGITEENHHVLLPYPVIGNGPIDVIKDDGKILKFAALCLRGGTCYLIPTSKRNETKDSIAVIPFPHDIESDLSDIYVQAFTAGNIMFNERMLPILIYVWPRGIVDVYVCGLFHSNTNMVKESPTIDDTNGNALISREERRAFQDMIDNDSLLLFSNILNELRDDSRHPLLKNNDWQQFLEETKAGQLPPARVDKVVFDSICSPKYQTLRRILLSLAHEKK